MSDLADIEGAFEVAMQADLDVCHRYNVLMWAQQNGRDLFGICHDLKAQLAQKDAWIKELEEVIKSVGWLAESGWSETVRCVFCGGTEHQGHKPGCIVSRIKEETP